jgi:hypothetical protein
MGFEPAFAKRAAVFAGIQLNCTVRASSRRRGTKVCAANMFQHGVIQQNDALKMLQS